MSQAQQSPSATARTARAAIVRQQGGPFSVESVEIATPRADEVLVRMVGTGVCHTDLVCRDAFPVPMPIVLGHEGAGIVEAVGSKVSTLRPGDHVVLSFNSCGGCHNCAHEAPAYCFNFMPLNFGGALEDGSSPLSQAGLNIHANFFGQSSFATYAVVRESNAVAIATDLPLEIMGPLGCGIQTGAGAALNSLKVTKGTSFAIFGGGAVGLSALMAAKAVGAAPVIVVEPNAARRQLAVELGADATIDPRAVEDVSAAIKAVGNGGVLAALDTTGIPAVITTAADALLPNGQLGLVGVSPMEANLPVNIMSMITRGIGIKAILEGDSQPREFIPQLVELYRQGKFPFDRLIKTFPFEQINEAAHASEDGSVIKPVVVF
ncbi:NAD(P)-dependent alcohol dehydrogenase [Solimonas sp. K1W22B-7]|uniref:NAD(P)-dependent alcohol dehydrogenase n=1 Tax=Solimonas sp. K1W22B-7 TaxID=2303331 RepID=UPI000E330BA8|nr:NAD(P)-dependent alcohol dehydrogenase [Solimonas sp. K1W22B-7]AXQ31072.1 NAD(P)-dependent alcohol dehydrogenase [Solimonas sp. K1W22B-7]